MGRRSECKGQMKMKSLLVLLMFSQVSCFLPYALKQGCYQAKLLCGARPIERVLLDSGLSENDKNKLLLITAIKRFSTEQLGMPSSKNYTTINPKWRNSLKVVSASKELAFEPYLWEFPIVGKVPYLGYFDEEDAISEEKVLKEKGYDTMLREVGGYSSIGYFNDPVWPKMLQRSDHSLSELVLHELAHSTLYFKNQTDFNESFANFVGKVGSLQFLQANFGSHSLELYDAILYNEDEMLYAVWLEGIYDRLAEVYRYVRDDLTKLRLKSDEIANAKKSFQRLEFRSQIFRNMSVPEINNAYLLMSRRYKKSQGDFEKLYVGLHGNWLEFFNKLKTLNGEADPFKGLHKLASDFNLEES